MKQFKSTRGEMGFQTLILLIAIILIAAITSGILLIQAQQYQSDAHSRYRQTAQDISVAIQASSVTGHDARDEAIEILDIVFKLLPGASYLSLDNIRVKINLDDASAILKYRGVGANNTLSNTGFNTWRKMTLGKLDVFSHVHNSTNVISDGAPRNLLFDIDKDGINDSVIVCSVNNAVCDAENYGTHLAFNITSYGWIQVELRNYDGTLADISSSPEDLDVRMVPIGNYGYYSVNGTTAADNAIGWGGEVFTTFRKGTKLDEDLNDDTLDDYVGVTNDTMIVFISGEKPQSYPLGVDLATGTGTLDVDKTIVVSGETLGTIRITGQVGSSSIPENATIITPDKLDYGYYTVEYNKKGNDYLEGHLSKGDIVTLHLETPKDVVYGDSVSIHLIDGAVSVMPISFGIKNTFPNQEFVQLFPTV